MRKLYLCWIICLPLSIRAQLPLTRYIISLKDKKGSPYNLANPQAYLSTQSLQRRLRQGIGLDSTDLPVSPVYLDSMALVPHVTILNVSKWLNQVLIRTNDSAALARVRAFSFVRQAVPIAAQSAPAILEGQAKKIDGLQGHARSKSGSGRKKRRGADLINYGTTYGQIHIHHGEYLHNLGFQGEGMTIAVIDDGFFGYLKNPVFDSVRADNRILGSWDFVNDKESVDEEDIHGMYCLSTMAADLPGLMVGTAPKAKFWLFKTEDLSSEYPVEEQNWAAAAEMADSAGADIITTSLGYTNFDDTLMDHSYAQRNGHTAISSMAADLAASKGMIVLAAAGNSGAVSNDTKYVGCPGDADSALTVGAVDALDRIASFSSWGPNSSGRIKPDVVSVGVGTILADTLGYPTSGNGTSFSTPNLAGLVACLWEAFPEFDHAAIADAVRKSANKAQSADNRYGYGLPDFEKAFGILETERGADNIIHQDSPGLSVFPVPYTSGFTVVFQAPRTGQAFLSLIDVAGRSIETLSLSTNMGQWYTAAFTSASRQAAGVYYIRYASGGQTLLARVIKQ